MRVAVLGPLEVTADAGPVTIGSRRERALLTLLAVCAPRPASMAQIVDGIWGEDPPRSAHKAVQTAIVNLRHKLPVNVIVTTADGYLLEMSASDIDMHRFETLIATSRMMAGREQIAEAEKLLVDALALWRGNPVGDLSASTTGYAEAARLSELKLLAEEEAADLALAQGRHSVLIAQLQAAVTASPLRERRWAQLMLVLYRSGRQADALRTYQRLRTVLGDELGIEPSPELVVLEEAILVQKPEIGWSPREVRNASPDGASGRGALFPDGIAEFRGRWFVGRQAELQALTGRWNLAVGGQRQTVVLVGEPGVGKSALVAALAERVAGDRGMVILRTCQRRSTSAVSAHRRSGQGCTESAVSWAGRVTIERTGLSFT